MNGLRLGGDSGWCGGGTGVVAASGTTPRGRLGSGRVREPGGEAGAAARCRSGGSVRAVAPPRRVRRRRGRRAARGPASPAASSVARAASGVPVGRVKDLGQVLGLVTLRRSPQFGSR